MPLLLVAAPSVAFAQHDADGDGAPDDVDQFPCDASAAAITYVPAQGAFGTIMLEDYWPLAIDNDYNDNVVSYNHTLRLDGAGRVSQIRSVLSVVATSGSIDHGLGLHFAVPTTAAGSVTIAVNDGPATALIPSAVDQELTLNLVRNIGVDLLGAPANAVLGAVPPADLRYDFSMGAVEVGGSGLDLSLSSGASTVMSSGQPVLRLNGTGSASHVSDGAFESPSFTLSAWINIAGACPSNHCSVMSKGDTDATVAGYWLVVVNGQLRFTVGDGAGNSGNVFGAVVPSNAWHHVTATWDAGTQVVTLYQDGVQTGQTTLANGLGYGNQPFIVGGMFNRSYFMNGDMDDVEVRSQALSPQEVTSLYWSNRRDPTLRGTVEVVVNLSTPTAMQVSEAPYDVFTYRTGATGHEIHTMDYCGTTQMDAALFGQGIDSSDLALQRCFTDEFNLPSGLVVPHEAGFPREGKDIAQLYPQVLPWAASGGATNQDWYLFPVSAETSPNSTVPSFPANATNVAPDLSCLPSGTAPASAAASCLAILNSGGATGDGSYWLDPNGGDSADAFQAYCDMTADGGGWMRVTPSMVDSNHTVYVTLTQSTDANGGLFMRGYANASGCGTVESRQLSYMASVVPWSSIRANYAFRGTNSCWEVFGHVGSRLSPLGLPTNLIPFELGVDVIRNQSRMGGSAGNAFDGINARCDNQGRNFWHSLHGGGTRRATVILRKLDPSMPAALATGMSCTTSGGGTSSPTSWDYSNIFVR